MTGNRLVKAAPPAKAGTYVSECGCKRVLDNWIVGEQVQKIPELGSGSSVTPLLGGGRWKVEG